MCNLLVAYTTVAEIKAQPFCCTFVEAGHGDCAGGGNEGFGDELVFGGAVRFVQVVLDIEIVADLQFLLRDHRGNLAAGLGQVGPRAGEDEFAVLAAVEEFAGKAGGKLFGRGGERDAGAVDLPGDFA
jgi:hypothetical protein